MINSIVNTIPVKGIIKINILHNNQSTHNNTFKTILTLTLNVTNPIYLCDIEINKSKYYEYIQLTNY